MTEPESVVPDIPATQIDDHVETVVEHPVTSDVTVEVEAPTEPAPVEAVEHEIVEPPPPAEVEESAVAESPEVTIVAADSSPSEEVKHVEKTVERTPDTRPKRKLGWRAFILGGSGGTH